MKLCLNTYNLAANCNIEQIISLCKANGIAGIEFSIGYGHRHGIEADADRQSLVEARDKITDAGLQIVSISTFCRFDSDDPLINQLNIEKAEKATELANIMHASIFRYVGNDIPKHISRDEFLSQMRNIAERLSQKSKKYGIKSLLNLHGGLRAAGDVERIMRGSSSDSGIVYNCDPFDAVSGSAEASISTLLPYIRHIHMHSMLNGFPYKELFCIMKKSGYNGWYSIAVDESVEDTDTYLGYYTRLARSMYESIPTD